MPDALATSPLDAPPEALPADLPAVILAGGLGTRLRATVADRPKVMAEVRGRPFLAWWLDYLERQGVREVVLCLGFRAWQVQQCFGARYQGLSLTYSTEPEPLGTGGALRHALPCLGADVLLVLNGDSFCEVDLGRFWSAHQARSAPASILMTQAPDTGRFGRLSLDQDRRITSFAEKGASQGAGWINAGVYLLARRLLQALPPGQCLSLERDLLPHWLAYGVYGFPAPGRFIDIGTPESYALAQEFFAPSDSLAAYGMGPWMDTKWVGRAVLSAPRTAGMPNRRRARECAPCQDGADPVSECFENLHPV